MRRRTYSIAEALKLHLKIINAVSRYTSDTLAPDDDAKMILLCVPSLSDPGNAIVPSALAAAPLLQTCDFAVISIEVRLGFDTISP